MTRAHAFLFVFPPQDSLSDSFSIIEGFFSLFFSILFKCEEMEAIRKENMLLERK